MEILDLGFEIVRKNKIMMPHPLKEYLRVRFVTSIVRILINLTSNKGLLNISAT
jgi:hypothetical protein